MATMNNGGDQMNVLSLQCYECDTEYEYIGSPPHLGRCQACGSRCVPPAGALTLDDWSHWESPNGLQKVWLQATDERTRSFEFEIVAHDAVGKLTGLKIDGTRIAGPLEEGNSLFQIPASITNAAAQLGISELDSAPKEPPTRDT